MTQRKNYTLLVSKDGKYWYIRSPELNMSTQAKRLKDVEHMGRDMIATVLDIEPSVFDVTIQHQP